MLCRISKHHSTILALTTSVYFEMEFVAIAIAVMVTDSAISFVFWLPTGSFIARVCLYSTDSKVISGRPACHEFKSSHLSCSSSIFTR